MGLKNGTLDNCIESYSNKNKTNKYEDTSIDSNSLNDSPEIKQIEDKNQKFDDCRVISEANDTFF